MVLVLVLVQQGGGYFYSRVFTSLLRSSKCERGITQLGHPHRGRAFVRTRFGRDGQSNLHSMMIAQLCVDARSE